MKEKLLEVMKYGLIIVIIGAVFYGLAILLKRDPLTLLSIWLTAIATTAIAILTFMNYQLIAKIQRKDEEYKRQIRDYFEATVISNIVGGPHEPSKAIKTFGDHYKGETKIFN